jgi:hypothetical protein
MQTGKPDAHTIDGPPFESKGICTVFVQAQWAVGGNLMPRPGTRRHWGDKMNLAQLSGDRPEAFDSRCRDAIIVGQQEAHDDLDPMSGDPSLLP